MLLFIIPSFLKNSFVEYKVLDWLSTLNISSHCLLVFMVSDEKSAVILTNDPLYGMSCFFFAAFRILLCLLGGLIMMRLGAVSLTLSFLVFVKQLRCVCSCLSSDLGSFWLLCLQMYFLSLSLFFSSSGTPIMHRLVHLQFSYEYFRLFIFFILFSLVHQTG